MIVTAAKHTVRVMFLFACVFLIAVAMFSILLRVGLPLVASQKSQIESRVSDYLKSPVKIGDLSLRWEGFGPLLHAEEVSVYETAERLVTLDELLIDINLAKSLLRGIPIINELSLVGASLAIEFDTKGQLRLHGMQFNSNVDTVPKPPSSKGVDIIAWLFNARKVGLLNTQLTLIDLRDDQQLVVEDLNIRAENVGSTHQFRVDANLPPSLGGHIEAGIDLVGNSRALPESDGSLYLSASTIDVRGLMSLLQKRGLLAKDTLHSMTVDTQASVELWGTWQDGQLTSARGPFQFGKVIDALSGATLFDGASANMNLDHQLSATNIQATDIMLWKNSSSLSLDKLALSRRYSEVAGTATEDEQPWEVRATGGSLPLDLVTQMVSIIVAQHQPELAKRLSRHVVSGSANNVDFQLSGSFDTPVVNLSMDIDQLAVENAEWLPAFGPLNGRVSLVESVGRMTLEAEDMPISLSTQSDQDLSLDTLQAAIDIDISDTKRALIDADIWLADNGIDTSTRFKATFVPGVSPHLDVQTSFSATDIAALKMWLPRKVLPAAATEWVDSAILEGEASEGSLLLFGNVSDFPFNNGEGVFKGSVKIQNSALAYLPGWPQASNVNGTLELDGFKLTAMAEDSTMGQFNVSKTRLIIADLTIPVLELSVTAEGGFNDAIAFGANGPLHDILEPAIGDMSGTGSTQMDLDLEYALYRKPPDSAVGAYADNWRPLQVDGTVFLNKNDIKFGRADQVLNNATGAVNFDEHGVEISNFEGLMLGQKVRLHGGTQGHGDTATTSLTISGAIEANDLLSHYGNPLDQFLNGASQWDITIRVPHSAKRIASEGVGLVARSDLMGTQLLLPAPFDKVAASIVPFTLSTEFRGESEQHWQARYGEQLRARVGLVDDTFYSMIVELGKDEISEAAFMSNQEGIRIEGVVERLAVDGWVETVSRYIDSFPAGEGNPEPIMPISTAIDTDKLIFGSQSMGKATLRSNADDVYLNFAVSNQALKGNLRFPREHWSKDTSLKVRVELLDWAIIDALSEEDGQVSGGSSDAAGMDPRLLPPIEARVSTLVRQNVRVRDLVFRAQPNVSGLDITTLGFAYETMRLVGQGFWYLRDPQEVSTQLAGKHTTQLNLVLQSDDFGVGFDEVGLSDIIDEAQGSVEMKLGWAGPLYLPEIASLDGSVVIDMQNGSIVPLEPGAGRMVGLFALQTLPRRLNLDFKDMTNAGLAFNSIAGRATINNGVATVPLLQLEGPIGVVDISGTSDMNSQQFDQTVTVLPRVSAALPVIGAITGGASAGIGAFVAAGLLKALGVDFDRLGLRTYSLTGDWADPVFTPVAAQSSRRR